MVFDGRSVVFGVWLVLLVAFVVSSVRWVWGGVNRPFQPQRVVHTTEKTPWQVLMGALQALVVFLVIFVLTVVLYLSLDLRSVLSDVDIIW